MGEKMNIQYSIDSPISCIEDVNTSFARGRLKVMYTGENRNKTDIMKSSVVKALPTLYNVPLVCNWDYENGTIGGHDVKPVTDDDGNIRLMNLTEPCGVVPESAVPYFSVEKDDNGVEHEYLVVDGVLLWKRQDVYNHIVNDLGGNVSHSMEITVNKGYKDQSSGCYCIQDFEFTALCLLENCEPCFQGSELSLYSYDNFKKKFELMMEDFKEAFSVVNSHECESAYTEEKLTKGGEVVLEKQELLNEYGIDVSTLDFSIEEFTVDELREKLESMKAEVAKTEEPDEPASENFELTSNINEGIYSAIESVTIDTEWGQVCRYGVVDTDMALSEVYVYDRTDWLLYGLPFSMDGDNVVVDFASKKRKKYAIVDFDGGEQASMFADTYAAMTNKLSELAEVSEKYEHASAALEQANAELEDLRKFKSDVEFAAEHAKKEEVLALFEDLAGDEKFEALKSSCDNYSIDELEEKCYAIRGRKAAVAKFSVEAKSLKLSVEREGDTEKADKPYGGIVEEYSKF